MRGTMEVYALILVLSIIQSLFGVGILLFGTPILLLMGFEYHQALFYLLPASIALSWSQVWTSRQIKLDSNYRLLFFLVCLPFLFLGMSLITHLPVGNAVKFFILLMLVLTFIIRSSTHLRVHLQQFMQNHLRLSLGVMGLIHGMTNMGGSILTPLVSSLYRSKEQVLAGVSFNYAFMASFQLSFLILFHQDEVQTQYFMGALISFIVNQTLGKRVFALTSDYYYQRLINGLILANAVVLGIRLI
jgi:uncharacterized protein